MDTALTALVERHRQQVTIPQGWPTPTPRPGQSNDEWTAEVARLRSQHDAASLEAARLLEPLAAPDGIRAVRYVEIPVGDGVITARVYLPTTDDVPILALLHGGSWWTGGGATGFELNDPLCRALCARCRIVLVNIDYRLAPEHPYPTQLEDVHRALMWIVENAGSLNGDPSRLGVLGISSGGNLAAAVALLARDRGRPRLRAQFLHVPALDATASSPSMRASDPTTYTAKLTARALYTVGQPDLRLGYISPVLAPDLHGLPDAVISVGEFDPLRDEAHHYAHRLRDAGVPVRLREYPMTHTLALPDIARQWETDLIGAVGDRL